jgi:hypothetical protein
VVSLFRIGEGYQQEKQNLFATNEIDGPLFALPTYGKSAPKIVVE